MDNTLPTMKPKTQVIRKGDLLMPHNNKTLTRQQKPSSHKEDVPKDKSTDIFFAVVSYNAD